MVGQPILLRSLKSSGGTESTGGGARSMAADDVVRSMPSLSRAFKSPDGRRSFFHHAALKQPRRHQHLSAPAAAGSAWPSRTLRSVPHLECLQLPGVRGARHETPHNLNFWQALSSCAACAAWTRARARSQCRGLWQSKRKGHALPSDGGSGQSLPLFHHLPPSHWPKKSYIHTYIYM